MARQCGTKPHSPADHRVVHRPPCWAPLGPSDQPSFGPSSWGALPLWASLPGEAYLRWAVWGPRTSRPKYPCAYISDPMISVSLSTIKLVIKEHP